MVISRGFNRAVDRVEKAARALRSVQTQRRNLENGAPEVPPTRPAAAQAAGKPAKSATKLPPAGSKPRHPLVPIKTDAQFQLDATRRLDPYFIREYFGDKQLPTALEIQTPKNLEEAVNVVEERTGKRYTGSKRDRGAMYDWILANM